MKTFFLVYFRVPKDCTFISFRYNVVINSKYSNLPILTHYSFFYYRSQSPLSILEYSQSRQKHTHTQTTSFTKYRVDVRIMRNQARSSNFLFIIFYKNFNLINVMDCSYRQEQLWVQSVFNGLSDSRFYRYHTIEPCRKFTYLDST